MGLVSFIYCIVSLTLCREVSNKIEVYLEYGFCQNFVKENSISFTIAHLLLTSKEAQFKHKKSQDSM